MDGMFCPLPNGCNHLEPGADPPSAVLGVASKSQHCSFHGDPGHGSGWTHHSLRGIGNHCYPVSDCSQMLWDFSQTLGIPNKPIGFTRIFPTAPTDADPTPSTTRGLQTHVFLINLTEMSAFKLLRRAEKQPQFSTQLKVAALENLPLCLKVKIHFPRVAVPSAGADKPQGLG